MSRTTQPLKFLAVAPSNISRKGYSICSFNTGSQHHQTTGSGCHPSSRHLCSPGVGTIRLQPQGCAQGPWKLSRARHNGPCPILRHPGEEGSWSWDSPTHPEREVMKRGRRKYQEVGRWLNPVPTKNCKPSPKIKLL